MKRGMMGIVLLLLLLYVPCLTRAQEMSADQEKGIELKLELGYAGKAGNSDACMPVIATMINHGEDFEGQLELEIPSGGNYDSDLAEKITMIGNDMDYTRNKVSTWKRDIELKAGETRQEIFYLTLPWNQVELYGYLKEGSRIVQETVVTKDFSNNQNFALVGLLGATEEEKEVMEDFQIYADDNGEMNDMYVSAYRMDEETFPENWNALSQLDLLMIWPDVQLTDAQWLAVDRWQQEGGFVLKIENGQNFWEAFENFLEGDQRKSFFNELSEKWGYVVYSGYDNGQIPVNHRPSVIRYFILILLYAFVAGPGLYVLLKRQGKRKYFWPGVSALAVVFLGIVVWMGNSTRLTAPILTIKRTYTQQDHIWGENIQLGVQAPYNNTYQLYLDKSYHLVQSVQNSYSSENVNTATADKVEVYEKENCYKLTFRRQPVFATNIFFLSREHTTTVGEEVQVQASGDNETIRGTWKNPTEYEIANAVLILTNRIVFLGDLKPGEEGTFSEKIYSYGNGGLEKVLRKHLNLKGTEYPDYELSTLMEQIWNVQKDGQDGVYLIGTVTGQDTSFEMNSGYEVYGNSLFCMQAEINWSNEQGEIFCPDGESLATVESGSATADTNLMYGQDAVLDYDLQQFGQVTELRMFIPEYDDFRYFEKFCGKVFFYRWDTETYEEIRDWEQPFDQDRLKPYLSDDKVLRIWYQVDDDVDVVNKNCTLPCMSIRGKVVQPDA